MPTTPGGLPYPAGTDFVVNGDDAIKALAEGVDTAFRTPRFQEFSANRQAVPAGSVDYILTLVATAASVPPFPWTWTAAEGTLTLPAGWYLYTASLYIDFAQGGVGAYMALRTPGAAASTVIRSGFAGTQGAVLTTLLRVPAPTAYVLEANHNAGAARNFVGTVRIQKFSLV